MFSGSRFRSCCGCATICMLTMCLVLSDDGALVEVVPHGPHHGQLLYGGKCIRFFQKDYEEQHME